MVCLLTALPVFHAANCSIIVLCVLFFLLWFAVFSQCPQKQLMCFPPKKKHDKQSSQCHLVGMMITADFESVVGLNQLHTSSQPIVNVCACSARDVNSSLFKRPVIESSEVFLIHSTDIFMYIYIFLPSVLWHCWLDMGCWYHVCKTKADSTAGFSWAALGVWRTPGSSSCMPRKKTVA